MTDAEKLIYDAVQDLSKKLDVVKETVTEATTKIESIVGNGQPGRLQIVEQKQDEDHDVITKLKGALIIIAFLLGLSGVSEAIVHFLKR